MTLLKSEFEYLEHIYSKGGSLKKITPMIFFRAKQMLGNAHIANNLHNALILAKIKESKYGNSEMEMDDYLSLFEVLMSFYRDLIDDVVIISSFEIYAKAILLNKQFIVHEIQSPAKLAKEQKNKPLHFRSYRALLKKGEVIKIKERTLTASLLLSSQYSTKLELSRSTITEMKKFNKSRNKIHFHMSGAFSLDIKKLNAIHDLKSKIEKRA